MDERTVHSLCFGAFELDLRTNELRRKGVQISVQEQPLQVLAMLLEHPGELITREELRRKLWPDDTFVDFDHGLNSAVNRLRNALGDSADNPRFIETIPRRGYRFVGQVSAPDQPELPAVKVKPDKIRLAVLPLNDYSDRNEDEYFSDGLTDELITQLSGLNPRQLGVIARTSTSQYKNTQKPIREIGQELDVDYVLEGSVRRVGERVRISAQLIDVKDETHLWAESFERDMRDVLLLQDEVSRSVAGSIRITLVPEREQPARVHQVDPEAYDAYLQGRFYWRKLNYHSWNKARLLFERAIARDPGYAAAYSGLADCYIKDGQFFVRPPREVFPLAREAAMRAIAIDPNLAEAHSSMALILCTYDWDWTGAEHEFNTALLLGPDNGVIHSQYAFFLMAMDRKEEALREARMALVLEPLGNITNSTMGHCCLIHGDYGLADAYCRKAIEIEPESFTPHWLLSCVRIAEFRIDEAIALINRAVHLLGWDDNVGFFAAAYAAHGQQDKILPLRDEFEKKAKETFIAPTILAMLSIIMGDLEQVFKWLDKAYEERDSGLFMLKSNPSYGPIRSDPRFQALLRRMNFPT